MFRDMLLEVFKELNEDDIRSTSMGAKGEDILLSQAARKLLPIQIECKNKKQLSVYPLYDEAKEHGKYHPVLVIKQNYREPLVVLDARLFVKMLRKLNGDF
jgi:hypothetical protein